MQAAGRPPRYPGPFGERPDAAWAVLGHDGASQENAVHDAVGVAPTPVV